MNAEGSDGGHPRSSAFIGGLNQRNSIAKKISKDF